MSQPLIWKLTDKADRDDVWPKQIPGISMIYMQDSKRLLIIGGDFNAYDNLKKNINLNTRIIKGIEKDIRTFFSLENDKLKYMNETVHNSSKKKFIDIFIYELTEQKWYRKVSTGKVPCPRAFQQCVYINPYVFCFGGVVLGSKSENLSTSDLYVLNILDWEWKHIICKTYPKERTEFSWNVYKKNAILFGGSCSPYDFLYDDVWCFNHNEENLFESTRKEISGEFWVELPSKGRNGKGSAPGALKAHSAEVYNDGLFVFGGLDSKKTNRNSIYRYDLLMNTWELLQPRGKPPGSRAYHNMGLIDKSYLFIFGGIEGDLVNIRRLYSDCFLYNIDENVWVEAIIGGIQPSPRLGFSIVPIPTNHMILSTFKTKSRTFQTRKNFSLSNINSEFPDDKMSLIIFGGLSQSRKQDIKLYELREPDKDCKNYWTIRDSNYTEGENDENYLIHTEKQIQEYKDRINRAENEINVKEAGIVEMTHEIEIKKKTIFEKFGYIDDQSQSLKDFIKDLENQTNVLKESIKIDNDIYSSKLKLKSILARKSDKSLEFFCTAQNLFVKNYDILIKAKKSLDSSNIEMDYKTREKIEAVIDLEAFENIRNKFIDRLSSLKTRLKTLEEREDYHLSQLKRFKPREDLDEIFRTEIEAFKIDKN